MSIFINGRGAPPDRSPEPPVLFFDGVCVLCNRSVRWIVRRDRERLFRFAALESATARRLLPPDTARAGTPATVLLLEAGSLYARSEAWLRVIRRLGPPWSWLGFLGIVPRPVRDRIYDGVAARRYRWFGRHETCPMPEPSIADRFLS